MTAQIYQKNYDPIENYEAASYYCVLLLCNYLKLHKNIMSIKNKGFQLQTYDGTHISVSLYFFFFPIHLHICFVLKLHLLSYFTSL